MDMTPDLRELLQHPSVHQMLRYTFVGDAAKVKDQTREFLSLTRANELMTVATIYDPSARIHSARIFSTVMQEINEEVVAKGS